MSSERDTTAEVASLRAFINCRLLMTCDIMLPPSDLRGLPT
ncbi:hypothetical protein FB157_13922 [Streptomyces sp. BK340]|nr:hypothetical protein FB157_13922 [Streptomyces sp. BK340]